MPNTSSFVIINRIQSSFIDKSFVCISLFRYYIYIDIITDLLYVYNNNISNICIILQRLGGILFVGLRIKGVA